MKELIINGEIYAKYEYEGYHLYLKVIKQLIKGNDEKSENLAVYLIQYVENKKFYCVSYLNI